jgi:hypothetical protein
VTQDMQILLDKCKCEKTKTFEWTKKLRNAFLNPQQMSIQQVIHLSLSIALYHSTRSFQFINTCEENDRAFSIATKNIEQIISKFNKTSTTNH